MCVAILPVLSHSKGTGIVLPVPCYHISFHISFRVENTAHFRRHRRKQNAGATVGKRILVIGGAGFVGSNLTNNLLNDGLEVTVFDALLRTGSEKNLVWLQQHPNRLRLRVIKGDVRNVEAVKSA